MLGLTPDQIVRSWEDGAGLASIGRALAILAAARPDLPRNALMSLTIGERDSMLLDLRERTFGPVLTCLTDCPDCRETVEFEFSAADIRRRFATTDDRCRFAIGDASAILRAPTSADLAFAAETGDSARAAAILLQRCTVETTGDLNGRPWTNEAIAIGGDRLADLDPQAGISISLTCPACIRQWETPFDIGAHLWDEVSARARLLLRDIHQLASAYGWSEHDILALSDQRRQTYLEFLGQ